MATLSGLTSGISSGLSRRATKATVITITSRYKPLSHHSPSFFIFVLLSTGQNISPPLFFTFSAFSLRRHIFALKNVDQILNLVLRVMWPWFEVEEMQIWGRIWSNLILPVAAPEHFPKQWMAKGMHWWVGKCLAQKMISQKFHIRIQMVRCLCGGLYPKICTL